MFDFTCFFIIVSVKKPSLIQVIKSNLKYLNKLEKHTFATNKDILY